MTNAAKSAQGGMALFVSLMFLLLLTIIGVAGMQNATLQEKMAGNSKLKNESFQYAEAGLREGESLVAQGQADACDACDEATCAGAPMESVPGLDAPSSSEVCEAWKKTADNKGFFYIQKLGTSSAAANVSPPVPVVLYRITSVASVGNATTALESVYAKN